MKKIVAAIVTYNRVNLLLRCLKNIVNQSCSVEHILVVDNDSTDSTFEDLSFACNLKRIELSYSMELYVGSMVDVNLYYLKCSDNSGSAGGVYEAMRFFMTLDCDFLWLMDDDGFPSRDCLLELTSLEHEVVFPLVLNEERPSELAFSLFGIKSVQDLSVKASNGLIYGTGNPWNGVLLSKKVISDVGLVYPGFFIWGEEFEYLCRLERKFEIVLTMNATFFHPADRLVANKFFCHKRLSFVVPDNFERRWIYYRNYSFIYSRYKRKYFFFFVLRYFFYFLFIPKRNYAINLIGFVRSLSKGVVGKFVNKF